MSLKRLTTSIAPLSGLSKGKPPFLIKKEYLLMEELKANSAIQKNETD